MENKDRNSGCSPIVYMLVALVVVINIIIICSNMNKNNDKVTEVSYNQFIEMVDNGEVDTVWYSDEAQYMNFVTFTEETKGLSIAERSEYKYKDEDKQKCLYPATEEFRETMLKQGVNLVVVDDNGDALLVISTIFQIGTSLLMLFWVFHALKGVSKQVGNIGLNNTPVYELINKSNVKFSDVVGHDEVIRDLKFLVRLLQQPELGERVGAKVPKGILFTGAPGTGKTMLAKALAGEAKVPFIYMNASSFIEMYVGTGAKRVREVFKEARNHAPCILFLDEIDSIGGSRTRSNDTSEHLQTINALLQEMDGFDTTSGVLVIAATNNAKILDKALTRAGRFDREVIIPEPRKWETRYDLFKFFTRGMNLADDVSLELLAKETAGSTGADIQAICNEAALIALNNALDEAEFGIKAHFEGETKEIQAFVKRVFSSYCFNAEDIEITMDEFEEALDKKMLKGNRKVDTDKESKDQKLVAYHESGHAVASWLLGKPIAKTTIIGTTSGVGGYVKHFDPGETVFKTKQDFENDIIISYAGRAAEHVMFGKSNCTTGASSDIEQATSLMRAYLELYGFDSEFGLLNYEELRCDGIVDSELMYSRLQSMAIKFYNDTFRLIKENQMYLEKLAEELLECEDLTGEQIEELLTSVREGE